MTSLVQERIRMFSFDPSTMEDNRFSNRNHLSGTNREKSRERMVSPTDDEDRIPPPPAPAPTPTMEIVTNASSNHPDFEAWKRDMTETLLSGTVGTSPNKSPTTTMQRTDWTTTRLNRRRLEKRWLQQQLRSVKSDTSTTTESESSDDEDSSMQSCYSSSFLQKGKDARKNSSKSKPRSGHGIHTVYVRNQPGDTGNTNRHFESLPQNIPTPLSPRSFALQRPTMSAVEAPLSPKTQPNSKDLAEIMVELKDLKTWAEGVPPANDNNSGLTNQQLRQSTQPSSPSPPAPSANRKAKAATKAAAKKDPPLPKSIEVPQLLSTPESIVVPELMPMHEEGKKYKSMIERRVSSKEKGIPTMLTIQTISTASESKSKSKTKIEQSKKAIKAAVVKSKKKQKRVRFSKPLITDTKYRPMTRREDVDALFFQEEELLDWENDEVTTLQDRFEVVVTEFGNQGNEIGEEKGKGSTGKLSIGTPVISFHNSYSNSFQDSSDEESCHC